MKQVVVTVVKVMMIVNLENCNSVAKTEYVKYVPVDFVHPILIVQMEVVVVTECVAN